MQQLVVGGSRSGAGAWCLLIEPATDIRGMDVRVGEGDLSLEIVLLFWFIVGMSCSGFGTAVAFEDNEPVAVWSHPLDEEEEDNGCLGMSVDLYS